MMNDLRGATAGKWHMINHPAAAPGRRPLTEEREDMLSDRAREKRFWHRDKQAETRGNSL